MTRVRIDPSRSAESRRGAYPMGTIPEPSFPAPIATEVSARAVLAVRAAEEANVLAESDPIVFPTATNPKHTHYRAYAIDSKPMLMRWFDKTMRRFSPLAPTEKSALATADAFAIHELQRPLQQWETRLLGEVARDWITAHVTLAKAEDSES